MITSLIILPAAILFIVGFIYLIKKNTDFLEDTDYRLAAIKEIHKEFGSIDAKDWGKLPEPVKKKLSMSRLSLLISVLVISMSVLMLIIAYLYLAIEDPMHLSYIDLSTISWIILLPGIGMLPYVFGQLKKVRL